MDTALPLDGSLWGTLLLYSIGENLKTQKGLMKKVAGLGGWMGDLTAFGNFWRDRHNTKFELLRYIDGTLVIKLNSSDNNLNPAVGFVAVNTKSINCISGAMCNRRPAHPDKQLFFIFQLIKSHRSYFLTHEHKVGHRKAHDRDRQ